MPNTRKGDAIVMTPVAFTKPTQTGRPRSPAMPVARDTRGRALPVFETAMRFFELSLPHRIAASRFRRYEPQRGHAWAVVG